LSERFNTMWVCHDLARAGEPEAGIHDMRVEAKRLREAMRLFRDAFQPEALSGLIDEVDRLNDRLGAVRDSDVLIEYLDGLFPGDDRPLLVGLRAQVQESRPALQCTLTTYLDQLVTTDFEPRFDQVVIGGRHPVEHPVAGERLKAFAPLAVGSRLRKVMKRLRGVQGEEDADGLHRVRVANKHLRYAMEAFLGIYDSRFQDAHRRVVALHKALGDIHDYDVLRERLIRFAEQAGRLADLDDCLDTISRKRSRAYGRIESVREQGGEVNFARDITRAID
jgi:CHAD domain-containing protein